MVQARATIKALSGSCRLQIDRAAGAEAAAKRCAPAGHRVQHAGAGPGAGALDRLPRRNYAVEVVVGLTEALIETHGQGAERAGLTTAGGENQGELFVAEGHTS